MKKILLIILCIGILFGTISCGNGITKNNNSRDSVSTDSTPLNTSKTLLEEKWDSLYNVYNKDGKKSIKNEIVQGEMQIILMGYIWDNKGKHVPAIEEPVYKCLGLAQDNGKYYGLFEFDNEKYSPNVRIQLVGEIPYEKAKELVTNEKYKVKGEIVDFAYPGRKELWARMTEREYYSGCLKLKHCTFERK